jgi:ferredoxin
MADKSERWEENVPGRFYVDRQCIDCDLCRETAPDFFTRNEDGGYSFVHAQPQTEEDNALCMEALEGCPVDAIGHDGDESSQAASPGQQRAAQ